MLLFFSPPPPTYPTPDYRPKARATIAEVLSFLRELPSEHGGSVLPWGSIKTLSGLDQDDKKKKAEAIEETAKEKKKAEAGSETGTAAGNVTTPTGNAKSSVAGAAAGNATSSASAGAGGTDSSAKKGRR